MPTVKVCTETLYRFAWIQTRYVVASVVSHTYTYTHTHTKQVPLWHMQTRLLQLVKSKYLQGKQAFNFYLLYPLIDAYYVIAYLRLHNLEKHTSVHKGNRVSMCNVDLPQFSHHKQSERGGFPDGKSNSGTE